MVYDIYTAKGHAMAANLEDIRKDIDAIDAELKELLMKRLDCSLAVAMAKKEAGSLDVYRAEREEEILANLGTDVAEDRKPEYLAIVRKTMEASRMYQYDLLYDWNECAFDTIVGHEKADKESMCVIVRFARANEPNALGSILCMVGDHGFNMRRVELAENTPTMTSFELEIKGDVTDTRMRKLLFQLSRETIDFRIVGCY